MSKRFVIFIFAVALALPALAQTPTGTLTGHVADGDGIALPGVTISLTSASMQGARTAVSSINGDYIFRFLPPGDYSVKFELQGFTTLDTGVKISAAQTSTIDAKMPAVQVNEEVTVTGSYETISTSQQVSTTYEQSLLNSLPTARTMLSAVALTPGVAATGPSGNYAISGAMSYENLFMVNGVVVTDNVRGTPNTLYIEDAIQETTTSTANVSAEYGRFAGGVVNTLTKSGGNDFHGSARLSLDNDKWAERTPKTVYGSQTDKINQTWEATLGGFILKDRLWFFAAGRSRVTDTSNQTYNTNIPFKQGRDQKRYEGKLTLAINPNHRVIGSYMKINDEQTNNVFGTILDLASLDKQRKTPQDLMAINYAGVLTDNFFVEAQYSKRKFTFEGSGGDYTDLIRGTVVRDNTLFLRSNAPVFCGVCDAETRDNEDYLIKGSWFLSTANAGSHDLVFGYDSFNDMRLSNNYQSGSNWVWWPTQYLEDANADILLDSTLNQPIPMAWGDGSSDFTFWPVLDRSKGTNFKTDSLFVNDKWRLSNNLSLNIGVRYDKNNGEDASHNKVAKDSRISPRLAVSWDIKGDGDVVVNAGYGHYVTAIAGSVADQGGGNPSSFGYLYEGPDVNTDCTPETVNTCLDAHQVLQRVFDWLFANGKDAWGRPIDRQVVYGGISGLSEKVGKDLKSPYAEEITVGASKRLGSKGIVRLDYVHREFKDLYITKLNMSTGQVTDELGNTSDISYIENSNTLKRTYDGVNVQANYRLTEKFTLGAIYTWSHSYGNYEGETAGSGPVANSSNPDYYPEYTEQRWTNPTGDLSIDQRHRARLFAVYDLVNTKHHSLSVSVMESFLSGTPYSASGSIYSYPYVTDPGYATRPTTVTYYFSKRGAFRTDDITYTDLGLNYAFKIPAFGTDIELFVQPRVTNLFNQQGVESVDTTIVTRYGGSKTRLGIFNPFTSKPVECTAGENNQGTWACKTTGSNWLKGPNFGKPVGTGDYQDPRTYSLSFGIRF